MSPSLLPQIIGVCTARETWIKLEYAYTSGSKAQGRELKQQLHSLGKTNSESVTEYMQREKMILDKLASFQLRISEDDLIDMILDALRGPLLDVCKTFSTHKMSFNDLLSVLIIEE